MDTELMTAIRRVNYLCSEPVSHKRRCCDCTNVLTVFPGPEDMTTDRVLDLINEHQGSCNVRLLIARVVSLAQDRPANPREDTGSPRHYG